jgi:hypothetical protein
MKIFNNKVHVILRESIFVGVVLVLISGFCLVNSEDDAKSLRKFKIIVDKTQHGVFMQGVEGTAWLNLEFYSGAAKPQLVNEMGMASLHDASSDDEKLADFLFEISRTKDGFALKGLEGTAWDYLEFSFGENGRQAFDEMGMTSLNVKK